MLQRLTLSMLTLLVVQTTTAKVFAQEPVGADLLWQKAVALSAANERWVPGSISSDETVYDKKGKVEETTKTVIKVDSDSGDSVQYRLIKVVMNGKDITQDAQQHPEAYLQDLDDEPEDNPFDPTVQVTVTMNKLDEVKEIGGRRVVAFSYIQKTQDAQWHGMAWLDDTLGIPMRVETQRHGSPIKEDGMTINNIKFVTQYAYTDNDTWYATEVTADIDFKLKFFWSSFSGTIKNVTRFQDYWQIEETKPTH